jgi:hypothetical protein
MPSATFHAAAGADDGYAAAYDVYRAENHLAFGGGAFHAFVRFPNVSIPARATIKDCHLVFIANTTIAENYTNAQVSFSATDTAIAPATKTEFTALSLTSSVPWAEIEPWAEGMEYQSPDLSVPLQEVINRSGWALGNAVLVVVKDYGNYYLSRSVKSFESNGVGVGLYVEWESVSAKVPAGVVTLTAPAPDIPRADVPAGVIALSAPAPSIKCVRSFIGLHRIPVGRDFTAVYRAPGIARDVVGRHSIPGWVTRELTARYAIPDMVARDILGRHRILDYNPVSRDCVARHAIRDGKVVLRSFAVSCVFVDDDAVLDLLATTVTGDLDSFAWTVDLTVPDEDAWLACTPGRRLTLAMGGLTLALLLESRSRDLQSGSFGWTATARTLSCRLDAPYAAALTQSWGETTAKDAAEGLAAACGLTLSWEVCNWTLPAGRLTAAAETPATVLARIAASCGAVVQPVPAGGVRIIYKYPVGVTEYAAASPAATLSDDVDVTTLSESFVAGAGYNAVTVVDNRATTDAYLSFELDADRNASRTTFPPGEPAYFRVYHDVAYAVRATSGRLEQVATDETENLTETVSFDAVDAASLGKLVATVDSVTWFGNDLGVLVPSGGSNVLLSAGAGFGVAVVAYTTRYDVWRLIPEDLADAFPVLLELAEATT